MRNFLFPLLLLLFSCNDDDRTIFSFELIKIESVRIPETLKKGEEEKITMKYFRPTSCHSFYTIDISKFQSDVNNEFSISILNSVIEQDYCVNIDENNLVEVSFHFFVGSEDSYVFRFWQGRDDQGENQFLIREVPVVD